MRIKPGVRLLGLRTEMTIATQIVDGFYKSVGSELVITSATEGQHSRGSLHYVGLAIDARTNNIPLEVDRAGFVEDIRIALQDDYDVIDEKDHLHIEFQPKLPY